MSGRLRRVLVAVAIAAVLVATVAAVASAATGGADGGHERANRSVDTRLASSRHRRVVAPPPVTPGPAPIPPGDERAALVRSANARAAFTRGLKALQADPRYQEHQLATWLMARSGVNWDGIARCETGGNWRHQTRYDGGLGILHAAWVEFGGRQFAPYGSQATRDQQIIVAERIHARYGLSGWGCRRFG